jgi:hypothetical protein
MTLRQVKRASDLHPKAVGPKPQAVIWSAIGDDRDTKLSVQLLTGKGASVTVNTLDHNPTLKTEFTTAYPTQKTLPYIIVDNVAIGGYKDLVNNPTYSMKAPPKAAAPAVKSISTGTMVRSSISAPKPNKNNSPVALGKKK